MNTINEIDQLLDEHGAVLVRHKKHYVYKLPSGQIFVRSSTPSDRNGRKADLRELKRVLGLIDYQAVVGERREKKVKNGRSETTKYDKAVNPLAEKLRLVGLSEASLKEQIAILTEQNTLLSGEVEGCWWCRFTAAVFK